jgi:16S rRNA processing protein RimM
LTSSRHETPALVRIGRVGRPHGVRGALTIVLDDRTGDCPRVATLVVEPPAGAATSHAVSRLRPLGSGRCIAVLEGVSDRESAAALTSSVAYVRRDELALDPSELLVADLPGSTIVCEGREMGRVRSTYHNGVHDVMVVQTGEGLVDFPVTDRHVVCRDDAGRIEVRGFDDFLPLAYGERP